MATLRELVRLELLHPVGGKLEGRKQEMRRLYATSGFVSWVSNKLPLIQHTHWGSLIPAKDQVIGIFRDYRAGEKLDHPERLNFLEPIGNGIWELKTGDVRIFGWFYDLDCFIASIGADANYLKRKSRQRYGVCINIALNEMNGLNIDPPACITSTDISDVIST